MGEPPQELVAAVLEHDRFGDHRAERRHARANHAGTRPSCSGKSALPRAGGMRSCAEYKRSVLHHSGAERGTDAERGRNRPG